MARFGRRQFLLSLSVIAAGLSGACGRVSQRAAPTPQVTSSPELDAWREQILTMLSEGLEVLRTFDVFAAFRISSTPESSLRQPSELVWDPPSGAAWDAATRISRGLHGRADQLFLAATTTSVEPSMWRAQRDLADVTHSLVVLGDALRAYRDRIDWVLPGDASNAVGLLNTAWAQWEATAARVSVSRSEAITRA